MPKEMNESKDAQVKAIVQSHYERNDPIGWFETLYATASGDTSLIPWADQKPNHNLMSWLDRERVSGDGRSAIVVGCGLGDDAEELARRGFVTSGFDISQSAIDWCLKRFPNSKVKYAQADLLNTPGEWQGKFDFVFEAYTIQALPRSLRAKAVEAVANLVRPGGGELLVICRGREDDEDEGSLPWPLSRAEIGMFESAHGLRRVSFENYFDDERDPPVRRFRALFRKD
jgi:SAM-dependent methyltransferase